MVDFRNIALGDQNIFTVENDNLFTVSEAADSTQGIRRQRLAGYHQISVPTSFKVVKIYDELNRILTGQIDFNNMIQRVGESFRRKLLDDIYALWMNATSDDFGGTTYFPAAGPYDEDAMLELVSHVEASASGKQATIIGTKVALRNLAPSIQGNESKSDLYNMGYFGRFYGTPVVALPQRHKVHSTDFVLPDNIITVVAGEDKPLKVIYEGDSTLIMGDPLHNQDLTQELEYTMYI